MPTTVRIQSPIHRAVLRPGLELIGLVVAASLAGLLLLYAQDNFGTLWIDRLARPITGLHLHDRLNEAMKSITDLGGELVLVLAGCTVILWSYAVRSATWARFFALVIAGGLALDNIVKPLVGRPRPVFDQLVGGRGESFPSGHATATTAVLFALALYLSHGRRSSMSKLIWGAAIAGSLAMGLSRIYLGVHWPTDVIAGSALGAVWVFMCARSQDVSRAPAPSEAGGISYRSLKLVPAVAALALVASACSGSSTDDAASTQRPSMVPASAAAAASEYAPDIDPSDFVEAIDNPYFPLEPGTEFRLRGATEDGVERESIVVTDRTKEILGVETTVVKDVARVDGEIAEFTFDWYAQDSDGNVWYFGEDTAEYENGKIVSREGSWEAGVDGAQPGIIMNADPQVTDSFFQEYYKGEAEDMYWVVGIGGSKTTPFGSFDDVLHTLEWTRLEPKIVVEKFYAPGVGLLAERALSGPKEIVELLSVTGP